MQETPKVPVPTHALEMLRNEHARMQELLDDCATAEPSERKAIADNLIAEAQVHILLAQEFVFDVAERISKDSDAGKNVNRYSAEIDQLAEEMAEVSGDDPRFQELHNRLDLLLSAHIAEEEDQLFPELQKLGDEELVAIGQKMVERREQAFHDLTDSEAPQEPKGHGGDDI